MKMNDGFKLTEIAGDYMVLPTGENMARFGGSVVLNEVSAFLLTQIRAGADREQLLALLLDTYDVSEDVARADLARTLKTLTELGLIGE